MTTTGSERNCPNCKTPLWRRANYVPKSSDFWDDYLDSPNREEHTWDRCRWALSHARAEQLHERAVRLETMFAEYHHDYNTTRTDLGTLLEVAKTRADRIEAKLKAAREALEEIRNWLIPPERGLETHIMDRCDVALAVLDETKGDDE